MRKGKKEITWTHERHVRLRRWCMGVCRRIASVALSNAAVSFFFVRDFLFPISRCATGEWLHIFFWNYYYFFFLILRRFIYYIAVFYFLFFVDFLLWFTEADFCHPVHTRIRHVFLPLMTSARLISSSQHGCRFISCIVACVSVFFFLVRITWISVMVQKLYWFHYHISLIFLFFERYFICLHCGTFHHLFSAVLVKWESAASISGTQCPRFSLIIQNRQMTVCVCVCFRKTFHLLNSGNECADPLPWFSPLIQNREEEWLI